MLETEEQRRWWFATHPEYSSSRRGGRSRRDREAGSDSGKVRPKDVDAYVDEALKYEGGSVADLLKSVKRNFGTEGEHRFAQADRPRPPSDNGASGSGLDDDRKESSSWDDVVSGIDDTLQFWERLLGFDLGLANASRKLARNLEAAGRPRPPGHQAHHIVPADDKRFPEAVEARKILKNFGIGISSADNGVWLPGKPGLASGAYHPGLHTRQYYREVLQQLRKATTKQQAIQTLQRVGQRLSRGSFPK